ncbi:hypothetical protein TcG_06241 [Trypanosoma cruzi]|nr:hypothetical protein TcG_06241 [Trypanosoma cruzi]
MVTGEPPKLTNGIYPPHKINAILYDAFLPYEFLERHKFKRSGDRQRQDKFLFSFIQGHSRVGFMKKRRWFPTQPPSGAIFGPVSRTCPASIAITGRSSRPWMGTKRAMRN